MKRALLITLDQLRWDYLSCTGHPHLETPNIDKMAAEGTLFQRAYCQSPLCGPSRRSMYTGRYCASIGAGVNADPLPPSEMTIADYLGQAGVKSYLIGKSGIQPNRRAKERLGADESVLRLGFEEWWRDDGLHTHKIDSHDYAYARYLKERGYERDNPWISHANSTVDEEGNVLSGWNMRYARLPADVKAEDSETAFTSKEFFRFLESPQSETSWFVHLSYNKPHWPYVAPHPYNEIYDSEHVIPAKKSESERQNPHPVHSAMMQQEHCENWAREEVRETVIPTYMGLIKELDDWLGRVYTTLKAKYPHTLIIFTSDHGDNLGDHWLGEKDHIHDSSVRVPFFVIDPASNGGIREQRLTELVDIVPTVLDYFGIDSPFERIEGRSLMPLVRGEETEWRDYAVSEVDYSSRGARQTLGIHPYESKITMIRNERWKYGLHERFSPQLFDMENDPDEVNDLGQNPEYEDVRRELHEALFRWFRNRKRRTEQPFEIVQKLCPEDTEAAGVIIGRW